MSDISIIDTQASNDEAQHELAVLRVVQENERTAQRDIARRAGISLGMTNAILKRLSQKGFLTVRRIKGRHGGGIMIGGPMGHKRTLTAIIEREENMKQLSCSLSLRTRPRSNRDSMTSLEVKFC